MKNVSCHCGKVKLQIKVDDIGNYKDVIVQFVEKKVR